MMYCAQLYNSVWLDVNDQISPCCFYKPQVLAGHDTVKFYQSGLAQARNTMTQGQWPTECQYCQASEQHTNRSSRTEYNGRAQGWDAVPGAIDIHTLGIFLGNKCNLHCAICDPKYSTGWFKSAEYFGLGPATVAKFDLARLDDLIPKLTNLRELYITGGEAIYQPELVQLIDYLSSRVDISQCKIYFASNGTLRMAAEQLERCKQFGSIELTLSIDAMDAKFEYMRHPAQWNDVVENIKFYKSQDISLRVNCTISPMNVYYMDEIATWGVKHFGLKMQFLAAQKRIWELWNLPEPLKTVLVNKYQGVVYAEKIISQVQHAVQDPAAWADFKQFIDRYDQRWNLSFAHTFPEWAAIVKEHNLW